MAVDKAKQFQIELKALLEKFDASICFDADDCSDWYGISGEKMVVLDNSDDQLLCVGGTSIDANDIEDTGNLEISTQYVSLDTLEKIRDIRAELCQGQSFAQIVENLIEYFQQTRKKE